MIFKKYLFIFSLAFPYWSTDLVCMLVFSNMSPKPPNRIVPFRCEWTVSLQTGSWEWSSPHSWVEIILFPCWSHAGSQTWLRVPSWVRMNHTSATSIITAACARCALVYLWNCVILKMIAKNNFIISLNSKMSFLWSSNPVSCQMLFKNKWGTLSQT